MMMEDEAEESDMSKASSPVSDSGNDDSGNDDEMKASSSGSEMDDVDDDDDDVENAIEYEDIDLDAALTEISQTELESEDTELWLFRIPSHLATTEIMVGKEVNINDHDRPINGSNVDAGSYNSGYKFKDCGVEGIEHMRAMFVHGDEHENQRTYLKIGMLFLTFFFLF